MIQIMGPWVPAFKSCVDSEAGDFITFSFATVDVNGKPKVRTCVYRGFLFNNSKTNVLTFTTDKRMMKYKELFNDCDFEACFYFHKSKKQFRFTGIAKIINNEITPSIILPKHEPVLSASSDSMLSSSPLNDGKLKHNNDDDEIVLELLNEQIAGNDEQHKLTDPLIYPLVSPTQVAHYKNNNIADDDIELPDLSPPSIEEWSAELDRQWSTLSRSMKSSFRKPTPGSKINFDKKTLLDAISRRVDGDKDEVGLENFSVVCMFVNVVDFVDLDNLDNRRIISSRVKGDQWKEVEVCP